MLYLDAEEAKYRAVESATNEQAKQYRTLYDSGSDLRRKNDSLNNLCTRTDADLATQQAVVADAQAKLDAAMAQEPPLEEETLDIYRWELKTAQSGLYSWQVERDKCYAERDAFHASGALEAHIAQTKQAFSAYESQYAVYLAARDTLINAQKSVGYTALVLDDVFKLPAPETLPRY